MSNLPVWLASSTEFMDRNREMKIGELFGSRLIASFCKVGSLPGRKGIDDEAE